MDDVPEMGVETAESRTPARPTRMDDVPELGVETA